MSDAAPADFGATVASELDWFFRRDGSMFPVSYASVPIEMSDGRGAVVAFNDIESRLRAEEELREREVRLGEEQSSLRRVAALVAGGADPVEVFASVAREVAHVLSLPLVRDVALRAGRDGYGDWRLEPAGRIRSKPAHRWRLAAGKLAAQVLRTGRPARIDDFADRGWRASPKPYATDSSVAVRAPRSLSMGTFGA